MDTPRFTCTGHGHVVPCAFQTNSYPEALRHFELTGHAVVEA